MGEVAEAMINGLFCESCGELIDGKETGYPRKCNDCNPKKKQSKSKKPQFSKAVFGIKSFLEKKGIIFWQEVIQIYGNDVLQMNNETDVDKICEKIQKDFPGFAKHISNTYKLNNSIATTNNKTNKYENKRNQK